MSGRAISRVGGISVKSGRRPALGGDALPTVKETRELARRMASGPAGRRRPCGPPSPDFWARVHAKLVAAWKARRGLSHLTRNELEILMRKLPAPDGPR